MAAPAGPCEWCGGPQQWTIIRGDMYTRCVSGCMPLSLEGLVPCSRNGERSLDYYEGGALDGTTRLGEGVPLEGGDVKETEEDGCNDLDQKDRDLPF